MKRPYLNQEERKLIHDNHPHGIILIHELRRVKFFRETERTIKFLSSLYNKH